MNYPQEQVTKQYIEREKMALISGSTADVRSSGVPYQLQSMEKNIACLAETISILASKLHPILRPQPEGVAKDMSNRSLGDSELSSFLARANINLEEHIRRLNGLIEGADL